MESDHVRPPQLSNSPTRPPTAAKASVWSPRAGPPTSTLVLPRPPTSRPEGISRRSLTNTSPATSTSDAVPTLRRTACRTDHVQMHDSSHDLTRPPHESRTSRVSTTGGQAPPGLSPPLHQCDRQATTPPPRPHSTLPHEHPSASIPTPFPTQHDAAPARRATRTLHLLSTTWGRFPFTFSRPPRPPSPPP